MSLDAGVSRAVPKQASAPVRALLILGLLTPVLSADAGLLKDVENAAKTVLRKPSVLIPKKPSDLIPGNTPVDKHLSDLVQKNAGNGEIGAFIKERDAERAKLAAKLGTEMDRVHEDGKTMARGGIDSTKQAITHPKQGVPRYLACLRTACASELIAKKRADEITREKRSAWEGRKREIIAGEQRRRRADTQTAIEASRSELAELELLQLGIKTQLDTVSIVLNLEEKKLGAKLETVAGDIAALSTAENQHKVYAYLRETLLGLVQTRPRSEIETSLRQKEQELNEIARANQMDVQALLIAIVMGMQRSEYQQTLNTAKMSKPYLLDMLTGTLREAELVKTELASKEEFLKELA